MKKSIAVLLLLFVCTQMQAQDYLDLAKLSFNEATFANLDETNNDETTAFNTYAEVYYPVPVSSKSTIIGGFTYENTRLGGLNLDGDRTNLIMARLNLGLKQDLGKGWTGTFVFLPKIASDFGGIDEQNFQVGGLSLFEKRYNARKGIKAGMYVSSEQFGTIVTPLIGFWYKSKNGKFYANAILPIRSEAQYSISERVNFGASLITSIKAYNLAERNSNFYVQEESIRFNVFAGYELADDSLFLRAKVGFDTTDYGLYNSSDMAGTQILTSVIGGDDRTRLNAEFDSAIFVGLDLVYRVGI